MKFLNLLNTCCLALGMAMITPSSYAEGESAATHTLSQLRIGVVDVQSAILKTNEGKAAREKIEKELGKKRQDILAQQNQLKKMQEDFQAQQSVLSDADKQAKQKEFQTKFQAFQQAQVGFDQEARQKESAALQQIFKNLQNEIQKISKQKNLDMVFDKSAAVLLYANNTADITNDLIERYNEDYKVKDKK